MIFKHLEKSYIEIAETGKKIEELLFDSPQSSIISARLYCELLVKKILEIEDIEINDMSSQIERINVLRQEELIDDDMRTALNFIRIEGNKAVHQANSEDLGIAISIHKKVFEITKWFIETYGDDPVVVVPDYKYPEKKSASFSKSDINEVVKDYLAKLLEENHKKVIKDEVIEPESDKSYLYEELLKLKESSSYAVENIKGFSEYKRYLHIERPIQTECKKVIEESKLYEGATLILLCGSVGDGKSHLINYFNEYEQELLEGFCIHNDATESFSPEKTSLETLRIVLDEFSDDKINESNSKMILAINLGVLHNFLESDLSKCYTKLKKYIDDIGIFESKGVKHIDSKQFRIINFMHYNLFELNENGISSQYISDLMVKLTKDDDANPFYKAYQNDVNRGIKGIHIENYKLLMNLKVQNNIKRLLSLAIFEEKEMISTRALFNFVFDIIVPLSEADMKSIDVNDYKNLEFLLPNLIFAAKNKSVLLDKIKKFDPLKYRNSDIDSALLEYYNCDDVKSYYKKHLVIGHEYCWANNIPEDKSQLKDEDELLLIKTFFRTAYFIGKNDWYKDEEISFDNFVRFLYGYHTNRLYILEEIDSIFRNSFLKWNGSPKSTYIFDEVDGTKIKTAYNVIINLDMNKYSPEYREQSNIKNYEMVMKLYYMNEKSGFSIPIEIDFTLFKLLQQVMNGYIPNRKDRENALGMEDFVRESIVSLSEQDKLLFEIENSQKFILASEKKITGTKYIFKKV